jgi:ABC-type transporter Mla MlaB component
MNARFELPAELTIYAAADTASALVAWLAGLEASTASVELAADQVLEVDGAGLQLLAALHKSCASRSQPLQITHATETLQKACATLGLQDLLKPTPTGACA